MTSWVRFVLSRLDDDEAAITRHARSLRVSARTAGAQAGPARSEESGADEGAEQTLTDQTPAVAPSGTWSVERMRAEIAAKRQLMGTLQELLFLRDLPMEKPVRDAALEMVKTLALPYREHVEYPGRVARTVVLEAPARTTQRVG